MVQSIVRDFESRRTIGGERTKTRTWKNSISPSVYDTFWYSQFSSSAAVWINHSFQQDKMNNKTISSAKLPAKKKTNKPKAQDRWLHGITFISLSWPIFLVSLASRAVDTFAYLSLHLFLVAHHLHLSPSSACTGSLSSPEALGRWIVTPDPAGQSNFTTRSVGINRARAHSRSFPSFLLFFYFSLPLCTSFISTAQLSCRE